MRTSAVLCELISREIPLVHELYLDSNNVSDAIQHMSSGVCVCVW